MKFLFAKRDHTFSSYQEVAEEEEGEEARQGDIINYFPSSLSCPLLLSSHSSFFKLRKFRPPCSRLLLGSRAGLIVL